MFEEGVEIAINCERGPTVSQAEGASHPGRELFDLVLEVVPCTVPNWPNPASNGAKRC